MGPAKAVDEDCMTKIIALIFHHQGFETFSANGVDKMQRITQKFLVRMMQEASEMAAHTGRSSANAFDVMLTLMVNDFRLGDLLLTLEDSKELRSDRVLISGAADDQDHGSIAADFAEHPQQLERNLKIIMPSDTPAIRPSYLPSYIPNFPALYTYKAFEDKFKSRYKDSKPHRMDPSLQNSRSRTRSRHLHPRILALHAKVQARRIGEASLENLVRNIESRTLNEAAALPSIESEMGPGQDKMTLGSAVNYRTRLFNTVP